MPALKKAAFILSAILLPIGFAAAQNSPAPVNPRGTATRGYVFVAYTLTQVTDGSRLLADGTRIQGETVNKRARDSQGRTRMEVIGDAAGGGQMHTIFIVDPVAGLTYRLNPDTHTATRMQLPSPSSKPVLPPPLGTISDAAGQKPTIQYDKLGTDIIDGVKVEGRRIAEITPVGYEGNDQPIRVVTESWYSPEFGFPLSSKRSDPREGDSETRVTDLSLAEPDPTLFQVPADYKIQDLSQNSQVPAKQPASTGSAGLMAVSRSAIQAHVNAPYSVTQVNEHTQLLADGTNIHEETVTKMARDSQGRTRMEMLNGNPDGAPNARPFDMIVISDPAAGVVYRLNPDTHTGTRRAIPPPISASVQRPEVAKVPSFQMLQLGTQTIDGLTAEGTRRTETIQQGYEGNDRPITTVSESWYCGNLGVMLSSKSSDPRTGNNDMHVTDLSLAEPDPALFQVPTDYKIQDQ